jgi:hypothetical protein
MAWIDPRAAEYLRKRFTRADAYRFAPPGTPEAKPPGYLHPSARIAAFEKAQQEEAAQQAAARELQRELLEIRRELDEVRLALAARHAARQREFEMLRRKSDLAWDYFIRTFKRYAEQQKAGFNPDQPRDDHGKWTGSGRDGGGTASAPRRVRLAGDITGFSKHGINQAISRGVSPASLHDAVVNPLQVLPQANGTTQYVGRGAVVVLNPLGQVVTTWRQ